MVDEVDEYLTVVYATEQIVDPPKPVAIQDRIGLEQEAGAFSWFTRW